VDIRKEPFVNESVDWQGVFSRQFLALPPGIFYGGISRLVAVELKAFGTTDRMHSRIR
jgi:hypothetical protein